MINLRDGSTVNDPRLDRLAQFDPRSRQYALVDILTARTIETRMWTIPEGEPVLDQGADGACVGFGVTNELRFNPVAIPGLDARYAKESIYWEAQRRDEWPGGSYPGASPNYEGTSVLAGMQTAKSLGFYGAYHWAFNETQLAAGVSEIGPAVIGIPWYSGMFRPSREYYLRVTGSNQGGHCILVIGINTRFGYYTIYNSWGPRWGNNGTARIRRNDMARLLAENGDAAIVTERLAPAMLAAAV